MDTAPACLTDVASAVARHGAFARRYLAAMWRGDALGDAVAEEAEQVGRGRVMGWVGDGCARPGAPLPSGVPEATRALVAEAVGASASLDLAWIDRHTRFGTAPVETGGDSTDLDSYTGTAVGRAVVMSRGDQGGPVGTTAWLAALDRPGALAPGAPGFTLTVRARLVHAFLRRDLLRRDDWDAPTWGTPFCQADLAFTTAEFGPLRLRHLAETPSEVEALHQRWRHVGRLLGVDDTLLPRDDAEVARLADLHRSTHRTAVTPPRATDPPPRAAAKLSSATGRRAGPRSSG
ncbi:MAG: oxygenase MpaB family protein [Aeromicrobium sp.]|uniref:oxygenase MpaB family protein n=1 Tax=Aeromicrobium sp. TaxID=1871063 RepID=UPI0039E4A444